MALGDPIDYGLNYNSFIMSDVEIVDLAQDPPVRRGETNKKKFNRDCRGKKKAICKKLNREKQQQI